MIVTFCGHSVFYPSKLDETKLLELLEETVGDNSAEMFLGEYGAFDSFAYACCKKYKRTHPNISLVFVTPYMNIKHQKELLLYNSLIYDAVIYPKIEDKPAKYAIIYRNRFMVEQADIVIAYITHDFGGAYKTYLYAIKKGKTVFNLADIE